MGAGFLICKDNDRWHVLVSNDLTNVYPYQKKSRLNPDNKMYRIYKKNINGNIAIITDGSNIRSSQIILTNTYLLERKKHINFAFLRDEYIPALKEIMAKNHKPVVGKSNSDMKCTIIIIAENKAYLITGNYGLSDIEKLYTSSELLDATLFSFWDKYPKHDLDFLKKCLSARYGFLGDSYFPMTYFNTKDFKEIEIDRGEGE